MRLSFIILLTGWFVINGFAAEDKEVLRLAVYPIAMMQPMEVHSIITNVSDKPITLPSNSYSGGVDGWIQGDGKLGIIFTVGCGSVGEYKLVPSPERFCPVTLQPGESTELPLVHATLQGEKTVEVTFVVDEDYARRYGWWFGHLKKKVTIGEGKNPYIVEAFSTAITPPPTKETQPNHRPEPTPSAVH